MTLTSTTRRRAMRTQCSSAYDIQCSTLRLNEYANEILLHLRVVYTYFERSGMTNLRTSALLSHPWRALLYHTDM